MNHQYNRPGLTSRLRHLALAAVLATGAVGTAHAQLGYAATSTTNLAGTYTDLGTTGTAITTASTDDANSAATPIGFPFTFSGTAFTDFVLNTNGFIKLGTAAPTGPQYTDGGQSIINGPVDGPDTNLLLPFNQDLTAGSAGGTEYRVATTGTSPNRVCTIQWKNISDKARLTIGTQYANFSFQVKLYETSNQIDFVYGTATAGVLAADVAKFVTVGIKGTAATAAQVILGTKVSASPWSATTFLAGPYPTGTNAHNVRGTSLPDPGRTYRFTIQVANDEAATGIQGYGSVLVPAGNPFSIRGVVSNAGNTPLGVSAVTLTISGANTFTQTQSAPAMAVGGTGLATFTGITLPNAGTNTVTISVPSDGNNNNNSFSQTMVTSANTFSFITPGVPQTSSFGFTAGATAFTSAFCGKLTVNATTTVTATRAVIGSDPNLAPNATNSQQSTTVFGVVFNATTGAILGRSADFVLTAADLGQLRTFTLMTPAVIPAGDFLVGLAQVSPANSFQVFPMAYQAENPARPGLFFSASVSGAPAVPNDNTINNARYMLEAVTAAPPTCATPTNLAVTSVTGTSASFSFTGVTGATGYQIVYGAQGFTPGGAGSTTTATFTGTTYTLPGLTGSTNYDFYIKAICSPTDQSTLVGPVRATTACSSPTVTTFPYAESFDVIATGQSLPCGITVTDVNADNNTWQPRGSISSIPGATAIARTGTNAMVYVYNTLDPTVGANDWFYTPALVLSNTQRYRVSFYYRSAGPANGFSERLEVKYGTAATPAGQTTTLFTNSAITSATYLLANNTTTPAVADITAAAGTYYVGFRAFSAADQGFLAVDDLVITAGPLATSEALKRAVSVFPNPSNTGAFNLEIHGANAKQALAVEVTNMLGQRVYTGTAKDNFTNTVNLSSLASGIYSIKVRNGEEYTQQQISIVK